MKVACKMEHVWKMLLELCRCYYIELPLRLLHSRLKRFVLLHFRTGFKGVKGGEAESLRSSCTRHSSRAEQGATRQGKTNKKLDKMRVRNHIRKRCNFCMETLLVPLRLLLQAAYVRNLDPLQRRIGSDLEQLS